jgi:hypothetical protein
MSSRFERTASETIHEGGFLTLRHDTFRHEDGGEVERDLITHPGAVGVLVLDGDQLWFVRELAEEIGKQATDWESLGSFYTSVGFTDEEVHLFLATGISDVDERPAVEEDERIDVDVRPISQLDALIEEAKDSKTVIALLKLKLRLAER